MRTSDQYRVYGPEFVTFMTDRRSNSQNQKNVSCNLLVLSQILVVQSRSERIVY